MRRNALFFARRSGVGAMVIGHGDGWAARGRWLFHVFHVFLTICFLLTQIDILVDIPTKDRNIELKISTNNFASERALGFGRPPPISRSASLGGLARRPPPATPRFRFGGKKFKIEIDSSIWREEPAVFSLLSHLSPPLTTPPWRPLCLRYGFARYHHPPIETPDDK